MSTKITYFNFHRRKFMKQIKNKFDQSVIHSKSFKTDNKQLMELNFKRIIDIMNLTLQRKDIFDKGNIYLVLQETQNYFNFLTEFCDNIKLTDEIDALKDRQVIFFQKQAEFEMFLKDNFDNPKTIIATEHERN